MRPPVDPLYIQKVSVFNSQPFQNDFWTVRVLDITFLPKIIILRSGAPVETLWPIVVELELRDKK